MKKLSLGFLIKRSWLFLLVCLPIFVLSGCGTSQDIRAYIKEKYDMKVDIVHIPSIDTGNMGDVAATVETRDGVRFHVFLDGLFSSTVIGDDYIGQKKLHGFKEATFREQAKNLLQKDWQMTLELFVDKDTVNMHADVIGDIELIGDNIEALYQQLQPLAAHSLASHSDLRLTSLRYIYKADEWSHFSGIHESGIDAFHIATFRDMSVFEEEKPFAAALLSIDAPGKEDASIVLANTHASLLPFTYEHLPIRSVRKEFSIICEQPPRINQKLDGDNCTDYWFALELQLPIEKSTTETIATVAEDLARFVEDYTLTASKLTGLFLYNSGNTPGNPYLYFEIPFPTDGADLETVIRDTLTQRAVAASQK